MSYAENSSGRRSKNYSEVETFIEETDLADHFESQETSSKNLSNLSHFHQLDSNQLASASDSQNPHVWSHSPIINGLVTSPSLSFQSHLPIYSKTSNVMSTTSMNRQMIQEANFLASFIDPPNSGRYRHQDPFEDALETHHQSNQFPLAGHPSLNPDDHWDRVLRARDPYARREEQTPHPFNASHSSHQFLRPEPSELYDSKDDRTMGIISPKILYTEPQALGSTQPQPMWEDEDGRPMLEHGVGFHRFSNPLSSPESLPYDWKPSQELTSSRQALRLVEDQEPISLSPPLFFDHRGRIILGFSKTRRCLRILEALVPLAGLTMLIVSSLVRHHFQTMKPFSLFPPPPSSIVKLIVDD